MRRLITEVMRWSLTEPNIGEIRKIYRFAWLPTRIGEYWVWLESYISTQTYIAPYLKRRVWREDKKEVTR